MPKRKKNYTMPHACVPLTNHRGNIPLECDQNARYRLQQSALDSFHAEIHGPVFLSVGLRPNFICTIILIWINCLIFIWTHPHPKTHHSAESSRKVRSLFLATDFYLTNVEPKPWILPTPP